MVPRRPPFWKFDTVDPSSPWFTRSCMKTHKWTFAKVGPTVHDNIFEVLIAGSLSYLYSWLPIALFYLHRGTSHIGSCWHVFSGRAAIGLSFREHKRRNGDICPFSCSALKAMFYQPVDPDRVISNHRDSSRVGSCQLTVCWVDFADSTTIIFHRC